MSNHGDELENTAGSRVYSADAGPRKSLTLPESWEDDFDAIQIDPESDRYAEPPSSTAQLFAKLSKPRLMDRDESANFPRSSEQGPISDPLAHVLERSRELLEKDPDSYGVKRKPHAGPSSGALGTEDPNYVSKQPSNEHSIKEGEKASRILAPVEEASSLPKDTDHVDRVRFESSPHTVVETSFSSNSSDPNADLSFEDSDAGSDGIRSPEAYRGGSKAATLATRILSNKASKLVTKASGNSLVSLPSSVCEPEISQFQEIAFRMADSSVSFAVIGVALLVDQTFFLVGLLNLLNGSNIAAWNTSHTIEDGIIGALFFGEVNLRLFSYGPRYYFHSVLRQIDYLVCMLNAVTVFINIVFFPTTNWLHVVRYIRLFRLLTVTVLRRERRVKAEALVELEELAVMLEDERSEGNRLVKWRIDSDEIAMGTAAGSGGFGAVYLGLFRGTLVAVKQLYQTKVAENTSIEEEAVTLVNLRHPNVVLFMGFVHEPDKLWIVTEYCSRGSLRDFLDGENLHLPASRILKFALGAARGLAYLHGQDPPVLHLDLKTANILISSGWDSKLADFGLSRNIDNIENNTFAGTIQYSAPEILEDNEFSVAADVYSFGICLWEMAARDIPYEGTSPMEVLWGVVKEGLRPPLDDITTAKAEPNVRDTTANAEHPRHPPQIHEGSKDIEQRDKKIDARIEAAMVVAAGSVQQAKACRQRISLPPKVTQSLANDAAVLLRRKTVEESRVPFISTKENAADFDDVLSPVTTGALTPSSGSSRMFDWPKYLGASSLSNSNELHISSKSQTEAAPGDSRYRKSSSSLGLYLPSGKSSPSQLTPYPVEQKHNNGIDIESQLPVAKPAKSPSSSRKNKNAFHGPKKSNGLKDPEPVRDFEENSITKGDSSGSIANPHSMGTESGNNSKRVAAAGGNTGLDAIATKVTQKIKALDDRPLVAKSFYGPSSLANAPVLPNQLLPKIKQELDSLVSRTSPRVGRGSPELATSRLTRGLTDPAEPVSRSSVKSSPEERPSTDRQDPAQEANDAGSGKLKKQSTFQRRLESFSGMAPLTGSPVAPVVTDARTDIEIAAQSEMLGRKMRPKATTTQRGPVKMPAAYTNLIEKCWSHNAEDRPTADDLVWQLVSMIDEQIRTGEH